MLILIREVFRFMLVIKKISFVILILSVSFFKLNAKDLNNLFDDLQKAENIYAAE